MSDDTKPDKLYMGGSCPVHGTAPVLRVRDDGFDVGMLHPLRDGQPIPPGGELVELKRCADGSYDARTVEGGPAMVNSPAFKQGWDNIFGGKQEVGRA
jgi:hypothetical protein